MDIDHRHHLVKHLETLIRDLLSEVGEDPTREGLARTPERVAQAWRDLLRGGDEALNELIAEHPQADRQHLRRLVRSALKEEGEDKPPAASRKLFRYLRDL